MHKHHSNLCRSVVEYQRFISFVSYLHLAFTIFLPRKISYLYLFFPGHAAGGAVVEALRYKPEVRGIDSRWCHWNFSLT
jgi:hypothetical protein